METPVIWLHRSRLRRQKAASPGPGASCALHHTFHMRNAPLISSPRLSARPYRGIPKYQRLKYQRTLEATLGGRNSAASDSVCWGLLSGWSIACVCALTLTLVGAVDGRRTPRLLVEARAAAVTWLAAGVVLALALQSADKGGNSDAHILNPRTFSRPV